MEFFIGLITFIGLLTLNKLLKYLGINRIFRDYEVNGYMKKNGTYVRNYRRSWKKKYK